VGLALLQQGTGGALCVYAAPLPDKAGVPDATTAPSMPAATLAALGPVPCVVAVNARGVESPEEIMAFARARRGGTALWWAALIGVSRGCQRARDLWMAGAGALCLVLIDGMAGQNPPTSIQLGFAQTVTAVARSGAILLVVSHTYIEQGKAITSTAEMARTATGWALAPPPVGETVRRVQAPAGDDPQPPAWRGGLVVFSTGSGPADANAHRDQMGSLLPLILADRVRPLVDLPERPEVVARGRSWAVEPPGRPSVARIHRCTDDARSGASVGRHAGDGRLGGRCAARQERPDGRDSDQDLRRSACAGARRMASAERPDRSRPSRGLTLLAGCAKGCPYPCTRPDARQRPAPCAAGDVDWRLAGARARAPAEGLGHSGQRAVCLDGRGQHPRG